MADQCSNCQFYWIEVRGTDGSQCRRFPPRNVDIKTHGIDYEFPWVLNHWWCGEWQPATSKPEKPKDTFYDCRQWALDNGATVRMANAIGRAGINSLSQLTRSRLEDIKNCGEGTILAILNWRDKLLASTPNPST